MFRERRSAGSGKSSSTPPTRGPSPASGPDCSAARRWSGIPAGSPWSRRRTASACPSRARLRPWPRTQPGSTSISWSRTSPPPTTASFRPVPPWPASTSRPVRAPTASPSPGASTATRPATRSASSSAEACPSQGRLTVFQVEVPLGGRLHAAADRAPEQGECLRQGNQPGIGDLLGLQLHVGQCLVAHLAAVEQVPDAGQPSRLRRAEIHRGQPTVAHLEPGFLAHLALARLPRGFPVRLHDAAGDGPAALVGRLEDQQPVRRIEDERARGHRNSRKRQDFLDHVTPPPRTPATPNHYPGRGTGPFRWAFTW